MAGCVLCWVEGPKCLDEGRKTEEQGGLEGGDVKAVKGPGDTVVDVEGVPGGMEGGASACEAEGDVLECVGLVLEGADVGLWVRGEAGQGGSGQVLTGRGGRIAT